MITRTIFTLFLALALVSGVSAATLTVDGAGSCDDLVGTPYCTIQAAIDDAVAGDVVEIHEHTYTEDVLVTQSVTLTSVGAVASTIIEGEIDIDADAVTVNGLTVTNPTGAFGIHTAESGTTGTTLTNNVVHHIGTAGVAGDVQAIYIVEADDVLVDGNTVHDVESTGASAKAIFVGDSTSENLGVVLSNNDLSAVTAAGGGYGILVNSDLTTGLEILDNTVSDYEGAWAHGISLDGDTPDAIVEGNAVSDGTGIGTGFGVAVNLESNPSVETVALHQNNFLTDVGVLNQIDNSTAVATENWWGDVSGPTDADNSGGTGALILDDDTLDTWGEVLFSPWLCEEARSDETTTDGFCDLDADGVGIAEDLCPATVTDDSAGIPEKRLGVNRWVWNGGEEFETELPKGKEKNDIGSNKEFTITDTMGCSCGDILGVLENKTGLDFEGHRKFGCSQSVLEEWIDGWYPLDSIEVSPFNEEAAFPEPTLTNANLFASEDYRFTANGVWERVGGNMFDAQYSAKTPDFTWGENGDPLNGDLVPFVEDGAAVVAGDHVDWGPLDETDHTYNYFASPDASGPAGFLIWMNDVTKYPDNIGPPLTVDVAVKLHD